ncbi:RagB/SusD family nutrient uptake outer membrane protein [Prevotella sp. 10(H)]|uniref:RagB/SusD family nutrient uptake outer membrane protein n=1 Tax=Prevotella sp. 10(H) TaxID=1158294 RepID=UPI0004A72F5F|nr:RagB/SusD family nutrient uptake outer membrane protein [Prevotella sp. 10(H)]
MKSFKYILICLIALMLVSLTACSEYLDKQPDDQISEAKTFESYNRVNQLVTDLYLRSKRCNAPLTWLSHFSSAGLTDEAEGTNVEGNLTNRYNTGDWSPTTIPQPNDDMFWKGIYNTIRRANVILAGIEKYKTPDDPINPGDLQKRIGEVYFLRGYLHYLLVRIYGEIPYMDYVVDVDDPMDFQKESVHSVIEKIVADANEGIKRLPPRQTGIHFARVDQGACLGLIAISRWVAALPLYNGAANYGYTGQRQFESEYAYDVKRWEAARDAAKAVLDLKADGVPRYSLYTKESDTDFTDSGNQNTSNSTVYRRLWRMYYDEEAFKNEAVWFVTKDKYEGWFGDVYPPSRKGSSRQQPVQEQVDEYEYIGPDGYGYPIYANRAISDGYDDGNPYFSVKRDPRFYRDIIFHGAAFRDGDNNPSTTNTAEGADKIGENNATTTGYYLRKYFQEAWNRVGSVSISAPPIWRLPEFIYIYAEAVNEISSPNQEIYDLVNTVRARAFMAPMPPECKTNKELMREYIKRERRVEFFYENKRTFETRFYLEPTTQSELDKEKQWLAAGSTNNERSKKYWELYHQPYPKCQRMINGMIPVEDTNGKIEVGGKKYRMERFCKEIRIFEAPKHYYWPIMQSELQRDLNLVQNPGW